MEKKYSFTSSVFICFMVYVLALALAAGLATALHGRLSPLWIGLAADVLATCIVFAFSIWYKNSSMYDPYWSVIPPFLAYYWMVEFKAFDFAHYLVLAAVIIWAIRLTVNWLRGWQGLNHEDWRYVMLREKNPSLYWLTNFGGIHMFPTIMVFLGMIPVYYALSSGSIFALRKFMILYFGFAVCIIAAIIEFISDEELRAFKKDSLAGEYIDVGLWSYSRHPNYFGEITFWFGLFVMHYAFNNSHLRTAIGFIAMFLMFRFASIPMMEARNIRKKPGYKIYMRQVSMLIPWFRKR